MNTSITKKERFLFWTEMCCRSIVIIIFLAAAIPKLFNLEDFAEIITAYGMLPAVAVYPVALFLPLFEIILAVGLLLKMRASKYMGIALLLFFLAILSYAIAQGLDIDCGCFGPEDPKHRAFQGLRVAIVRDVVMVILLSYSLWYEKCRKSYN